MAAYEYKRKTEAELEQLAQDLVAGRVFHSSMVADPKMLGMVFMVLSFLDREQAEALQAADIASFYEYLDKAGPRSVNGMPCFFSHQSLDLHDTKELFKRAMEVEAFLNARKKVPSDPLAQGDG